MNASDIIWLGTANYIYFSAEKDGFTEPIMFADRVIRKAVKIWKEEGNR